MDESMMKEVADELVALGKRYGQDKLKIPRDPQEAMSFIRKYDYRKESEFSIDDSEVITEAERLADKHRLVLVVTNTSDLTYAFYVPSDEGGSAYSYTPSDKGSSGYSSTSSSSPSKGRGCLIAIVALGALFVIWMLTAKRDNQVASSRQSASQQGTVVGTVREVRAEQLNMRSGPGKQYSVVRVFARNERIVSIGEPQNVDGVLWIEAATPDGQIRGWVSRKLLYP